MKEQIEELKREVQVLNDKLNKLEEEAKELSTDEIEDYVLQLRVNNENDLDIFFMENDLECHVGEIGEDGECRMISNRVWLENYELWRDKGMETDISVIKWRGGEYKLQISSVMERIDVESGCIYDFDKCAYQIHCNDTNIIRHKHNNKPVGF